MIRFSVVVAVLAVLVRISAAEMHEPLTADFRSVIRDPQKFAGKIVSVRALQTKLKKGEWGLLGDCWPPVLLVLPKDVSPTPEFILEETRAFEMLLSARNERVSFKATFIGRFDWSGSQSPSGVPGKPGLFGKSRTAMRFVLRRVLDPERIVLPYK